MLFCNTLASLGLRRLSSPINGKCVKRAQTVKSGRLSCEMLIVISIPLGLIDQQKTVLKTRTFDLCAL